MKFTKMHGCGNDYVYINGFTEHIPEEEKADLVRRMSNRNFGVGSDGVIFINPSDTADFEMEMYNADGSYSEMCGNGIRCVGKYVYDKGMTQKTCFTVASGGQIKTLELTVENHKATRIRVNMGEPILEPSRIPVLGEGKALVGTPITLPETNETYEMTCVSMGNPHAVIFMDEIKALDLTKTGPMFENHPCFPNRTNTEFVKVLDASHVQMRVWERGTGETLACGTGCCAVAVACVLNGLTKEEVTVSVPGGDIQVFWDRQRNQVYMTGPAETVFEGEWVSLSSRDGKQ